MKNYIVRTNFDNFSLKYFKIIFMAQVIFLFGHYCSSSNYNLQAIPWTEGHVK